MADFTLGPTLFPVGTTVGVYDRKILIREQGGPVGGQITSGVVGSDQKVTFTGLAYGADFHAAASVGGAWQKVAFSTAADPALSSDVAGLNTRTDALESDRQKVHARPSIQYVDQGGSDANDGKSWGKPKLTVSAAHAALGSKGGTVQFAGVVDEAAALTLTKCVRLSGLGAGVVIGASEAVLRFPAGVDGLVIDAAAQKSELRSFDIQSLAAGAAGAGRGLVIRGHGVIADNLLVKHFGSHGVHVDSDATHNANGADLRSIRADENGGNGFHLTGTDSNACTLYMCDASGNDGWGYWNENNSNIFMLPQCENNVLGAIKDTGWANLWLFPYVEGPPSVGQNVDLSAATDVMWWGQEFGKATLTPLPASTVRIVEALLKEAAFRRSAHVASLAREFARTDTANMTSGTVYAARALVHRTGTYGQIRFYTGASTPAGLTDLRAGVWNGDGVTKLAETANASGTVTTATTSYTLALASPLALVQGAEVFIGLGMIGTTLNVMGKPGGNTSMQSLVPALTRSASGWTTGVLPNLSAGTLQWPWVELIP